MALLHKPGWNSLTILLRAQMHVHELTLAPTRPQTCNTCRHAQHQHIHSRTRIHTTARVSTVGAWELEGESSRPPPLHACPPTARKVCSLWTSPTDIDPSDSRELAAAPAGSQAPPHPPSLKGGKGGGAASLPPGQAAQGPCGAETPGEPSLRSSCCGCRLLATLFSCHGPGEICTWQGSGGVSLSGLSSSASSSLCAAGTTSSLPADGPIVPAGWVPRACRAPSRTRSATSEVRGGERALGGGGGTLCTSGADRGADGSGETGGGV